MASLREIAKYCDYKDTLNMMLRDRLVCGVNHQGIQKRMLGEKELTYEKALEIALSIEAAEKDVKQFQKPTATCSHVPQENWKPVPMHQGASRLVHIKQPQLPLYATDA